MALPASAVTICGSVPSNSPLLGAPKTLIPHSASSSIHRHHHVTMTHAVRHYTSLASFSTPHLSVPARLSATTIAHKSAAPTPSTSASSLLRSTTAIPLSASHQSTALLLQRCGFSSTGLRWIRVRGKSDSSSSFLSNIYSPATSSSQDYGGGSTADSLTPHVRDHLFRVYSLVGGTVLAACVGSLLMITTPLSHVIPFWLPMVGGFVPLLWLSFAPPANMKLKTGLLITFGLLEGMAIAPLVLMSSMKGVLLTSLVLTGAIFGGFSAAAYLAPRASMVAWQGPLFGGLIGLMGLSLFSIFYPTAIAHSLILYGGLALFSVMIASDTQAMIERARCGAGDHVQDAMQMFLNLINIFVRIMQIMGKD